MNNGLFTEETNTEENNWVGPVVHLNEKPPVL